MTTTQTNDEILDAEVVEDEADTAEHAPVVAKTPWRTRMAEKTRTAVTNWWGYTAQPMSWHEAWVRSGRIDPRRVPGDSKFAIFLWHWSNRLDRPILFALIYLIAPGWAVGPLLFIACRPTRRWGLYLIAFALLSVIPAIAVAR